MSERRPQTEDRKDKPGWNEKKVLREEKMGWEERGRIEKAG